MTGLDAFDIMNRLPYAQGLQYQTIDLYHTGSKFGGGPVDDTGIDFDQAARDLS